jgi:hypothetical protein
MAWHVMKLLVVVAILLTSPGALACDLSLVAPTKSVLKKPVEASVSLAGDALIAGLFGVSAVTERQKEAWPSATSLHV